MKRIFETVCICMLVIFIVGCGNTANKTDEQSTESDTSFTQNDTDSFESLKSLDDYVVEVEITPQNYTDYFTFVEYDGVKYDAYGEPQERHEDYKLYACVSTAYEKGLIYYSASSFSFDTNFGGFSGDIPYGSYQSCEKDLTPTVERCRGTVIFIKAEAVTEYIMEDGHRKVVFGGEGFDSSYSTERKNKNISKDRPF